MYEFAEKVESKNVNGLSNEPERTNSKFYCLIYVYRVYAARIRDNKNGRKYS